MSNSKDGVTAAAPAAAKSPKLQAARSATGSSRRSGSSVGAAGATIAPTIAIRPPEVAERTGLQHALAITHAEGVASSAFFAAYRMAGHVTAADEAANPTRPGDSASTVLQLEAMDALRLKLHAALVRMRADYAMACPIAATPELVPPSVFLAATVHSMRSVLVNATLIARREIMPAFTESEEYDVQLRRSSSWVVAHRIAFHMHQRVLCEDIARAAVDELLAHGVHHSPVHPTRVRAEDLKLMRHVLKLYGMWQRVLACTRELLGSVDDKELRERLQLCTELLADHLLILLRHRCIAVQDLAAQHLHSFLELQRGLSFVPSDKKAVVYYVPGELVERLRDLVLQRWTLKEDEQHFAVVWTAMNSLIDFVELCTPSVEQRRLLLARLAAGSIPGKDILQRSWKEKEEEARQAKEWRKEGVTSGDKATQAMPKSEPPK